MTEKEKLKEIIETVLGFYDYYKVVVTEKDVDRLVDKLIENGIRDITEKGVVAVEGEISIVPENFVADVKFALDGNVDELKRRAEVAERIAQKACEIVFSQEIDEEDWENAVCIYKEESEKYCDEIGITEDMLYDCLKEQAEREIEEGK